MMQRFFCPPGGRGFSKIIGRPVQVAAIALVASAAPVGLAQETTEPKATPTAKAEAPSSAEALRQAFVLVDVKATTLTNLRKAIKLYEANLESPDVDKKAKVRGYTDLSRALLREADLLRKDAAKIRGYEKGRLAAQKAMKLDPKYADALFWDLANQAMVGQTRGITNSLFMLGDLKSGLAKVIKLNPRHNYARDTLSRIYHEVPGILGGSDDKSESLLVECIRRDSHFTPCKVTLARLYVDMGEEKKAKKLLLEVVNEKKTTVPNDYRKFNLPDAKSDLAALAK